MRESHLLIDHSGVYGGAPSLGIMEILSEGAFVGNVIEGAAVAVDTTMFAAYLCSARSAHPKTD